jgi:hypothetical protein
VSGSENQHEVQSANQASWDAIVRFYEDFVARPQWNYLMPILRLVKTVAMSERATRFRAGQTVANLKVSTAPYHGLKAADAFISIAVQEVQNEMAVAFEVNYSRLADSGSCTWICSEEELISVLDGYVFALEEIDGAEAEYALLKTIDEYVELVYGLNVARRWDNVLWFISGDEHLGRYSSEPRS